MPPSLAQSLVIAVLRLQGRKARAADGERYLEAARAEHATGPVAPPASVARRLRLSTEHAAGFPVHTLRPPVESPGAPTVLYLHGGSFIHGMTSWHWRYLLSVVEATGATVLAAQYPLAPEHSWRDCFEALLALARDVDVVMGDSAGGGIALALAQRLAAEGVLRDTVLIAPAVDVTLSSPDTAAFDARDPWLSAATLRLCGRAWAGDDDPTRPEVSPLFGPLTGLGRVLVFTGTRDVLHPQALQLAERVPGLALVTEPGCVHNYPILPIPEAARALETLRRFLRGKL